MRGTVNLILDTAHETPLLARSGLSSELKSRIFINYLKISLKLFTVHRIRKQTEENVLGYRVKTFDYGALHFLFREIFLKNTYFVKEKRGKQINILDCGSNIGLSIIYFKTLFPNATIHGFEPDPETFKLLEENIKNNGLKKVHLHNVALHKKEGSIKFYVDHSNPGWLTMSTVKERLPGKDVVTVKSVPLSKFIKGDIDILKMDVEGAESVIFEDLVKSGKIRKIKKMAIEFHLNKKNPEQFEKFLKVARGNGYEVNMSASVSSSNDPFQDVMVYLIKL